MKIDMSRVSDKVDTRERARLEHNAQIEIIVDGTVAVTGQLRNISLQGLYVATGEAKAFLPYTTGSVVVRISMRSGQSKLAIDVRGNIVRVDDGGCAISFTHPLMWLPVFTAFPKRGTVDFCREVPTQTNTVKGPGAGYQPHVS